MGDGGSYVEVWNVGVSRVITEEADGDWHVYMKDPTISLRRSSPGARRLTGSPPSGVPLVV